MSWTVAPRLVNPQATWSLWPTMMKGTPGRETPATWRLPEEVGDSPPLRASSPGTPTWRSASYQMPGTVWARCMSLERRGLPVAVWAPETAQLLEPAKQSSQMGLRRVCWRVRRSCGSKVVVLEFVDPTLRDKAAKDGAPGLCWLAEGSAVALARDAHISESRYGAPGFVVAPGVVWVSGVVEVAIGFAGACG